MVIKYASTHNLSEDEKAELYEDFGSGDKVTTNEESELSECPTTKKKSSLE